MIRIDDRETEALGTLLDACSRVGIDVPSLCHGEGLSLGGHCRACMVEVDGKMVAACSTPARDGSVVQTTTDKLLAYRRDLGELMISESSPRGRTGEMFSAWGVSGERYTKHVSTTVREERHPIVKLDLEACIHCTLCVRACAERQVQHVYSMVQRGLEVRLDWGHGTLREGGCVSCGACVAVCPSGAIEDVDRRAPAGSSEHIVHTTCGYCGVGCQLDVHTDGERVLYIDGNQEAPVNQGHLCVKGRYGHNFVRHRERLTSPLIRKNGKLEEASWEEALDYVAREINRLRGHVAGLASSRCTNEENYLLQKWMRAGLSTHDVDCCARVCHGPTAAGMRAVFGTGAATGSLEDIEYADVLLAIGTNTTESHPVTGARVKRAVLRGTPLVVVDPRKTELAELADVFLQPHPGTNLPLVHALCHVLIEESLFDRVFVDQRTEGFLELQRYLRDFSPEITEGTTGVPAASVRRAARVLGHAKRLTSLHGLGVTEHHQGTETVMAMCNLMLLRGALGRVGAAMNPLRGQNNVQGAADMGCQPDSMTGYSDPTKPEVRARFEAVWGVTLPETKGRTLPKMYDAIRQGDIRALYVFGEDLVQTDPNASRVKETLEKLELLVVQEIFLSETAKLAHVVLPGASFLEKDGTFTNGERRIQRVRQVLPPLPGTRPDYEILIELMQRTGYPEKNETPAEIMDEIAKVAPSFRGVSYERIDNTRGLQWPVIDKDHPGTERLHTWAFSHDEKASFRLVPYVPSPSLNKDPDELLLVTGRILEHYNNGSMTRRTNSVVLEEQDLFEIHPEDAAERGIMDGARVVLESRQGKAHAHASLSERVSKGVAFLSFHFPETQTNMLTSDVLDRIADCPEYKVTRVRVSPEETMALQHNP